MATTFKPLAGIGLVALLGACAPVAHHYGEAVKYNTAVQTINPAPVYPAGGAQPGDSGEHGSDAVQRYRDDSVKQPSRESASGGVGGGSSGGPR
ncbi:hypothetical protein [Sphingomicrobium nitratireducens]|uniref:hypothetical protein n=1 Tax=Sphingomicrobium nitratireducens TaxID=2964666 RepID=UPI00223FF23A|nr:hypothetical protein [Sphingomicrobium nitratireducens]